MLMFSKCKEEGKWEQKREGKGGRKETRKEKRRAWEGKGRQNGKGKEEIRKREETGNYGAGDLTIYIYKKPK